MITVGNQINKLDFLNVKTTVDNLIFMWIKKNIALTLAASNIFCTAAEISGPIPSPGIRVTLRVSALYERARYWEILFCKRIHFELQWKTIWNLRSLQFCNVMNCTENRFYTYYFVEHSVSHVEFSVGRW